LRQSGRIKPGGCAAESGFKQSDFGIKPFSAMLGAVRNKDEAVLYIDIFAAPAERRQEED